MLTVQLTKQSLTEEYIYNDQDFGKSGIWQVSSIENDRGQVLEHASVVRFLIYMFQYDYLQASGT